MSVKIKPISNRPLLLGESPHWDERAQALYFVCTMENTLHKYDDATRVHTTSAALEDSPSFIVTLEDHLDLFVVGIERKFVVIQWDGTEGSSPKVIRVLADVDPNTRNKINGGKADPRGRLFAGTMGHLESLEKFELNKGALYRLDDRVTAVWDSISISNGIAWDLEEQAMYHVDSAEYKVRRYDYDVETGDISNMKYMCDFKAYGLKGLPDGCTVDRYGNLWLAMFASGSLVQLSMGGDLMMIIELPTKQVTSCTFGGPDLDTLFVTSGCANPREVQRHPAGCTFQVTGALFPGRPDNRFKCKLQEKGC